MNTPDPGTRIIIIKSMDLTSDSPKVEVIGYGVYEGEFLFGDTSKNPPTESVAKEYVRLTGESLVPRLRTDDGVTLWGNAAYWEYPKSWADFTLTFPGKIIQVEDVEEFAKTTFEKQKAVRGFTEVMMANLNVLNKAVLRQMATDDGEYIADIWPVHG